MNDIVVKIDETLVEKMKNMPLEEKSVKIDWLVKGKPPEDLKGKRIFLMTNQGRTVLGYSIITNIKSIDTKLMSIISFREWYDYLGPQRSPDLIIPPAGYRIYVEEFGNSYHELRTETQFELDILELVLRRVRDSPYNNVYFICGKSSTCKGNYSYTEIQTLFNRLQWNCRVLHLEPMGIEKFIPWTKKMDKVYTESYRIHPNISYRMQINQEFLAKL
ncbi:MAG: hypothetical protein ACXADA_18225 [Candidatus Hodarchaeales archaeon]|jgi:hypothetical protein